MQTDDLLKRLPHVRGRLTPDAPLGPQTWFRVGGCAEVLFRPADVDDLCYFLKNKPTDIPVTVIGIASNLLVRGGGVKGVVIRLGGEFAKIEINDDQIYAGAGALDMNVARTAAEAGLGGLEFLSGIPGTIGGAVRMNAGAYGAELNSVLITADVIDAQGNLKKMTADDMGMSYRHNDLPHDVIFTGVILKAVHTDKNLITARMEEIRKKRESTQPIKSATSGSTFANPEGDKKAWQLIDEAGCRGLKIGGAQMSDLHCNFMINTGDATSADLEMLGEEVRRRVFETSGTVLRWEIERIGLHSKEDQERVKIFVP